MEEDSMFLLENVFIRDHKNLKLKIKIKSLGKMQGEISQKSKKKEKQYSSVNKMKKRNEMKLKKNPKEMLN